MNLRPWLIFLAASVAALGCGPFFYPAPPRLNQYPERFPVKTMTELLREDLPSPKDRASFDELSAEVQKIASELGTAPRDELIPRIDQALERNRTGDYRKRFANCLFDFRDLLEWNTATPDERRTYSEWRVAAMDWDDGFIRYEPTESWALSGTKLDVARSEWEEGLKRTDAFLERDSSVPEWALTPHWLVQRGAWQLRHGNFGRARQLFEQVAEQYPSHPRAEPALLMIARTYIEEWQRAKAHAEKNGQLPVAEAWTLKEAADRALGDYLSLYPTGRYAPDVPGWRAGLLEPSQAIAAFLEQSDVQKHPEVTRRAIRECEKLLSKVEASYPDDWEGRLPLGVIAKHPVAVLAFVYHFLDSKSRSWFTDLVAPSDKTDAEIIENAVAPTIRVRRQGQKILPYLATALVKQKERFDTSKWKSRYLCALAWTSTEIGDHEQAARICDLAGEAAKESDDLLFVKGVALQRAGRLREAITAFQTLRSLHAGSPVSADVAFRLASVLRDNHQAGLAFIELRRSTIDLSADIYRDRTEEKSEPEKSSQPPLHLRSEIVNWADTLLQFAPLDELESALKVPDLDAEVGRELTEAIGMRSVAREDFVRASRYVPPEQEREDTSNPWAFPRPLRDTDWISALTELQQLTAALQYAHSPEAKAAAYVKLADKWAALRGHFTLPSLTSTGDWGSDFYEGWRERHANAQVAGITSAQAATELESRDELRHAYNYYLKAVEAAPGTAVAATALWRANDALRCMAELSPWSLARAFESNVAATSQLLHQRLLAENPASPEAQLSVSWNFPPAAEAPWMPNDSNFYTIEGSIFDALTNVPEATLSPLSDQAYRKFEVRLQELIKRAEGLSKADMLAALETIRCDFLPFYVNASGSKVINALDDLTAFVNEPGTSPSIWRKYFEIRLSDETQSVEDPDLTPWNDYLKFLSLVRESGELNSLTQEFNRRPMSVRMREFLNKFPTSRKREAALARFAIATVREIHGRTGVRSTVWPESPKLRGYWTSENKTAKPKEIASMFAALDDYEREFPNGRYSAEMRLWRGVASIDTQDWQKAIDLLTATLDDQTKRDLHLDAALSLAGIFIRLLEVPEQRRPIIKALRSNRSAQQRLFQFSESDSFGARLACMREYLSAQFRNPEP